MAPALVHLPNGQTLTVTAVFGGLSFKSNELNIHHSAFPPGWTIVIQSQDELDPASGDDAGTSDEHTSSTIHTHRYRLPTLQRDEIFISSISNPSSSDFKPPTSPSRQIAMMLWATLWWYFHQVGSDISLEEVLAEKMKARPKTAALRTQMGQITRRRSTPG